MVLATALPLAFPRAKAWWVRIFDFPRLQLAVLGVAGLALWARTSATWSAPGVLLPALAAAAVLYQATRIWRYTPLAPREVERARRTDPAQRFSVVVSNVLQDNREAERLLGALRAADPDVVLCVETDDWWRERLDRLADTHPHAIRCPLSNTYGMLLYSRLPIEDAKLEFLVEEDVPSVQALVRLPSGARVWLHGVHPRPPVPGESDSSAERDAELVLVARRVAGARTPVVVCGDLNDVAWSRTTRLFQKLSGLVDPRKGRGFYGTFHARYPFLRFPLDHVFHSAEFRFVTMRLLPNVGSDHLPVYVALSLEPEARHSQEAPEPDADDHAEARETVAQARKRQDGRASAGAQKKNQIPSDSISDTGANERPSQPRTRAS